MSNEATNSLTRKYIFILAEAGIMLALAIVLNSLKLYKLPTAGSITFFGYLPLFVFAIRHGWEKGALLGAVYGLIDFYLDPYLVNFLQVFIDYILSYAALGLAGLATSLRKLAVTHPNRNLFDGPNVLACLLGSSLRLFFAILSGLLFFTNNLAFGPALSYCITYNFPYIFINTLMAIIMLAIINTPAKKIKNY